MQSTSRNNIDLEEIKSIPIEDFMVEMGHQIDHTTTTSIFFKSPFRAEKTASFSISKSKNRWTDFGDSERSGDIIDLAMKLLDLDFRATIYELESMKKKGIRASIKSKEEYEIIKDYKIQKINETVSNKALIKYLLSRAIDPEKVKGKVGEIFYWYGDKHYFSLAFKSRSGGYETRNKLFKGCISPKDLTHIKNGYQTVTIFEGFIDYLSLQSYKSLTSDIIVLNSCSLFLKAIPLINEYKKAYFMLDNDKTGIHTTKEIIQYCEVETKNLSYLYNGYKDVNEWMMSKKQSNQKDPFSDKFIDPSKLI